ncbi:hypothetical protein, partial [Poseidonocella sp. HB161398]|uniref:hypothetical protein n=1 Tax=Poseidonocella sp. HB161398 TaxID=2320855 RepID=UPI0019813F57
MSWDHAPLIAACFGACGNLFVLRRLSGCLHELRLARAKLARLRASRPPPPGSCPRPGSAAFGIGLEPMATNA